jgi:hypothetical protein
MKHEVIKLTYESLIALLQGKELHLDAMDYHFIFQSPFDGVFVTHEQLMQMRYQDQMGVLNFLKELGTHKETAAPMVTGR